MSKEYIYALYHYVNGDKVYFYVGRSEREQGIRFKEHRRAANSKEARFDTDVYNYIREKVLCTIFDEEVLCVCEDENPNDYEDYYVIKLIRAGHKLMNMKAGDAKKLAELGEIAATDEVIRSVGELRAYRKRQQDAYAASTALRNGVGGMDASPIPKTLRDEIRALDAGIAATAQKKAEAAKKREIAKAKREAEYQMWLAAKRAEFDACQFGSENARKS
jgi:hypothetical protein